MGAQRKRWSSAEKSLFHPLPRRDIPEFGKTLQKATSISITSLSSEVSSEGKGAKRAQKTLKRKESICRKGETKEEEAAVF